MGFPCLVWVRKELPVTPPRGIRGSAQEEAIRRRGGENFLGASGSLRAGTGCTLKPPLPRGPGVALTPEEQVWGYGKEVSFGSGGPSVPQHG